MLAILIYFYVEQGTEPLFLKVIFNKGLLKLNFGDFLLFLILSGVVSQHVAFSYRLI